MAEYIMLSLYIMIALVCFYGTGLFLWWWRKNNWRATAMYIYITTLLATLGFRDAIDTIAFYERVISECDPISIYDHWLWPTRIIVVLVIVGLIVGHMSYRAFYLRKRNEDDDNKKD